MFKTEKITPVFQLSFSKQYGVTKNDLINKENVKMKPTCFYSKDFPQPPSEQLIHI